MCHRWNVRKSTAGVASFGLGLEQSVQRHIGLLPLPSHGVLSAPDVGYLPPPRLRPLSAPRPSKNSVSAETVELQCEAFRLGGGFYGPKIRLGRRRSHRRGGPGRRRPF